MHPVSEKRNLMAGLETAPVPNDSIFFPCLGVCVILMLGAGVDGDSSFASLTLLRHVELYWALLMALMEAPNSTDFVPKLFVG